MKIGNSTFLPMLLCVVAATNLVGCATQAPLKSELKNVMQVNADRLSRLQIGMPLDGFRSVFPDAYPSGQSGETSAYEFSYEQQYTADEDWGGRDLDRSIGLAPPKPRTDTQQIWFYFYSGQLVKWGRPNDWPENPDQILEVRVK